MLLRTVCLQPLKAFDSSLHRAPAFKTFFQCHIEWMCIQLVHCGGDNVAFHTNIICLMLTILVESFDIARNIVRTTLGEIICCFKNCCRAQCFARTHSLTHYFHTFLFSPIHSSVVASFRFLVLMCVPLCVIVSENEASERDGENVYFF
jgi:hypothetical protein